MVWRMVFLRRGREPAHRFPPRGNRARGPHMNAHARNRESARFRASSCLAVFIRTGSARTIRAARRILRAERPLSVFRIADSRTGGGADHAVRLRLPLMVTPAISYAHLLASPNPKHVDSLLKFFERGRSRRGTGGFGVEIEHLPVRDADDTAVSYYGPDGVE